MKRGIQRIVILIAILGSGVTGWWITRSASLPEAVKAVVPPPASKPLYDPAPRDGKTVKRDEVRIRRDTEAENEGALLNQRSLQFADRSAMERFLAAAKGKGISILGSIDRLNALHVGFLSLDDLNALLDGTEESGLIYPVSLPTPNSEGVQEGAVGMGDTLLSWLGITGDNSAYGAGVKVAIIDTGSTLAGAENIFLVPGPAKPGDWNGHGTAVSSIVGQIAPGADMISIRAANDDGQSNSFLLAQGFYAAMDAGARVINVSMGSYGDSGLLRDAVEAARASGIMVFAAAGNDGYDRLSYPAAYPGVQGIGAVDANGAYLNFSNRGNVAMTAPGLDLITAWTGGQSVYFTGTSASTPIAAGVFAAAMSNGGQRLTATKAYDLVTGNLNDGGAPGTDNYYGGGMVDVGRIFRSGTAGIADAAIAANYVTTNDKGQSQLQVVVQNRGTSTLVNAPVDITIGAASRTMYVSTLRPGDITTFTLPFDFGANGTRVQSTISSGANDIKPSNNRRTDVYAAPSSN